MLHEKITSLCVKHELVLQRYQAQGVREDARLGGNTSSGQIGKQ